MRRMALVGLVLTAAAGIALARNASLGSEREASASEAGRYLIAVSDGRSLALSGRGGGSLRAVPASSRRLACGGVLSIGGWLVGVRCGGAMHFAAAQSW